MRRVDTQFYILGSAGAHVPAFIYSSRQRVGHSHFMDEVTRASVRQGLPHFLQIHRVSLTGFYDPENLDFLRIIRKHFRFL